jgi:DNA-binding response OmpR family regulator
MAGENILLIDDEAHILELARLYLERDGFLVTTAATGPDGLELALKGAPALVVLDVMLPGLDGFEVCRRLRAHSDVPVIMLTARDDDLDKILGLELGADDYMTKPFNPRELTARVKAILRRQERAQAPANVATLALGDVVIDLPGRTVRVAGQNVALRVKEFDVLLALTQHRDTVLSRDQLLDLAWGVEFFTQTRTVDVHVAQVRKALAASRSVRIETVTGIGYKLTAG